MVTRLGPASEAVCTASNNTSDKEVHLQRTGRESISTSHIERQNLKIRMQMGRLTSLTNAYSKKWGNLNAANKF